MPFVFALVLLLSFGVENIGPPYCPKQVRNQPSPRFIHVGVALVRLPGVPLAWLCEKKPNKRWPAEAPPCATSAVVAVFVLKCTGGDGEKMGTTRNKQVLLLLLLLLLVVLLFAFALL